MNASGGGIRRRLDLRDRVYGAKISLHEVVALTYLLAAVTMKRASVPTSPRREEEEEEEEEEVNREGEEKKAVK